MLQQRDILIRAINQAKALQGHPFERFTAVFDLDSTLFDVGPRALKILHDFANLDNVRQKYPVASSVILATHDLANSYSFKSQLVHLGLTDQPQEFYKMAFEYWRTHFFSNDWLAIDPPYEGAVDFVNELKKNGANIMYLTGRDISRMGHGSIESLKKWKFPIGSTLKDGLLCLKPHFSHDDAEFKVEVLKSIKPEVWFFENEPVNIHLTIEKAPHVNIIYFDSVHSGKAEPPGTSELPHIRSFRF